MKVMITFLVEVVARLSVVAPLEVVHLVVALLVVVVVVLQVHLVEVLFLFLLLTLTQTSINELSI